MDLLEKKERQRLLSKERIRTFCGTVAETQNGFLLFFEISSFSRTCHTLEVVRKIGGILQDVEGP